MNLDEMIMGVTVEPSTKKGHVRVKFVAVSGGVGPELNMPPVLLKQLHDKIWEFARRHPELYGVGVKK